MKLTNDGSLNKDTLRNKVKKFGIFREYEKRCIKNIARKRKRELWNEERIIDRKARKEGKSWQNYFLVIHNRAKIEERRRFKPNCKHKNCSDRSTMCNRIYHGTFLCFTTIDDIDSWFCFACATLWYLCCVVAETTLMMPINYTRNVVRDTYRHTHKTDIKHDTPGPACPDNVFMTTLMPF